MLIYLKSGLKVSEEYSVDIVAGRCGAD